MNILCLASGSGGHVYPMLELIKRSPNNIQIHYLCFQDGFENELVKKAQISYEILPLSMKKKKWKKKEWKFLFSQGKKYKNYDAILAGGGIASFVGLCFSFSLRKPLYLCEQNAVMGDANRLAYPFCKAIFTYIPLQKKKEKNWGNPREDAFSSRKFTQGILFFAGSLGSSSLREKLRPILMKIKQKYPITVVSKTPLEGIPTIPSLPHMEESLPTYRLLLMRAGATSISESIRAQVPALLFPSPFVKHDHQRKNAKWYEKEVGIPSFEEAHLKEETLCHWVEELYENTKKREEVQDKLAKLGHQECAKKIWEEILKR